MSERPHTWPLPLAPYRWAYLQLPSRNITEAEWEQLEFLLAVFKPGLVEPPPEPDAFPIEEALASLSPPVSSGVAGTEQR